MPQLDQAKVSITCAHTRPSNCSRSTAVKALGGSIGLPCSKKSRGVTKVGRSWGWGASLAVVGADVAGSAVSAPDIVTRKLLWTEPHGGDVWHAVEKLQGTARADSGTEPWACTLFDVARGCSVGPSNELHALAAGQTMDGGPGAEGHRAFTTRGRTNFTSHDAFLVSLFLSSGCVEFPQQRQATWYS